MSRWVANRTHLGRIATQRRRNFHELVARLSGLTKAKPLHSDLPDDVVPYVFPLLLEEPDRDFRRLKEARVPILRWEEVAYSDCPVSSRYVKQLVQLPCHQELTERDVEFIAETTSRILR